MPNLAELRKQYPQYQDLSDEALADGLYRKFYSDLPRKEFDKKVGLAPASGPTIKVGGRTIPVAVESEMIQPTASQRYSEALGNVKKRYFPQMPDDKWAEYSAKVFAPFGKKELANQGLTAGFQDEAGALAGALPGLIDGQFGQRWNDFKALEEARRDLGREQEGALGAVAEIAGGILSGGKAVGAIKAAPTLAGRALQGGIGGAIGGGVYGVGNADGGISERVQGGLTGATIGGAIGAAAPYVGDTISKGVQRFQQGRILDQAAKVAPGVKDLKTAASAMFDQADSANIGVKPQAFARLWQNIENKVGRTFRPNAKLDPKATGALEVLKETYDEVVRPGSNIIPDLKDLHMLRQAAQRAAISTEGRDATIAGAIVDQIDDFVKTLKPADIAGGKDPSQATKALFAGIKTWARASKASILEEAIYKAQNQASGVENGLRTQFRHILQNPKLRKKFNAAEIQAIEDVVRGSVAANLTKLLGKFGFAPNNMIGGTVGGLLGGSVMAGGNPLAGMALAAAGTVARPASQKLTERAANRAVGAVATQGLKVIPPVNPANVPLLEEFIRRSAIPAAGQVTKSR